MRRAKAGQRGNEDHPAGIGHARRERLDIGRAADDPQAVAEEVAPLFAGPDGEKIDVVVLACTHFPLIRAEIAAACPPGVELIDSGDAVARQVLRLSPPRDPDASPSSAATAYVTGGIANLVAMQPALKRFGYERIEVVDL